jgi:serine/threonine protein phosphatase PrpC
MAAAQVVCDVLVKFFADQPEPPSVQTIVQLLDGANTEITGWGFIPGTDRSEGACAGTVIWVDEAWMAHVFHVGDTGALLIRDGIAKPLTAAQHADGHLANYFGLPELLLERSTHQLEEGDRLLLFSDGISKVLYNQRVADIIDSHATRQASVADLIHAARVAGSTDDITALLVDIEEMGLD